MRFSRLLSSACLLILCCFPAACARNGAITQTGTIDALLAGQYDGAFALSDLAGLGDMGIGTFDRLDGEMVMLDGEIFQVRSTGEVARPAPGTTTPFAAVCFFDPGRALEASGTGLSFESLKEAVDALVPSQNAPLAILAHGRFAMVRTRSVPAQDKPYPPLSEVTKHQPEFAAENLSGTLVGFRLPPFLKGVNVTGYHLHFLSDDRMFGGHVLEFAMDEGRVLAQVRSAIVLDLPVDQAAFLATDQTLDRSRELEEVEN